MARLSADQIYAAARSAGFSPDQSVTMTAIALAESGGETGASNTSGENSQGLWQINLQAHSSWAGDMDLHNPVENAKAAFRISNGGQNVSPWTTTHGQDAKYLTYQDEAIAAAAHAGDPGADGNWGATQYGGVLSAGDPGDGAPPDLDSLQGFDATDLGDSSGPSAHDFVQMALSQAGDEYVWGADDARNGHVMDANPDAFDCQELVEWSAAKLGLPAEDASYLQYDALEESGHTMTVEEALKTPGALLFSSGDSGKVHHVAISLGDGRTIEARGVDYGVGEFDAGKRFDKAGLLPGLDYGPDNGGVIADPGAVVDPHITLEDLLADLDPASPDTDHDGLTDALEDLLGTSKTSIDTDLDGISDAHEVMTLHTDPTALDSDHDGLGDAREIAMGLDALDRDSDDDGRLDSEGVLAESGEDADADQLDDALETILGTRSDAIDSDGDGFSDQLEFQAGYDPTDADNNAFQPESSEVGLAALLSDVEADANDGSDDLDDDLDPDP